MGEITSRNTNGTLVVFAREPVRGRVKTRLAAEVGERAAYVAYRALLRRSLRLALESGRLHGYRVVIAADIHQCNLAGTWLHGQAQRHDVRILAQEGADLGARMLLAMRASVGGESDPTPVVLIGCDSPILDLARVEQAFSILGRRDAVLTPTEDGGYVLVGLRDPSDTRIARLFEGIDWGSDRVARQTVDAAKSNGFTLGFTASAWDVDHAADLLRWQAARAGLEPVDSELAPPDGRTAMLARRQLLTVGGVSVLTAASIPWRTALALAETRQLARFSSMSLGLIPPEGRDGWRVQTVRGVPPDKASIVAAGDAPVLALESHESASALVHRVPVSLRGSTHVDWRWQVSGFPRRSGFGERDLDDFAARVYVIFDYPLDKVPFGERIAIRIARAFYSDVPAAALVYVWHPSVAVDTLAISPYSGRARMLVARQDPRVGVWHRERRDLMRDFQRAFGAEYGPGMPPLAAIALGADTDQSGGRLTAYFGDVLLSRRVPPS
ncbi:MAG: TIGR04282 family arsenosugar biosynthesis glycosyltransferase [Burkholderiaceae bacterium]|nr:TIGR04282 family arsenosugar biosynthesis glycosyltransferase [Burkholderiaceae bacterium]